MIVDSIFFDDIERSCVMLNIGLMKGVEESPPVGPECENLKRFRYVISAVPYKILCGKFSQSM